MVQTGRDQVGIVGADRDARQAQRLLVQRGETGGADEFHLARAGLGQRGGDLVADQQAGEEAARLLLRAFTTLDVGRDIRVSPAVPARG